MMMMATMMMVSLEALPIRPSGSAN